MQKNMTKGESKMASKFISYENVHGVCESTLIRATECGHNYNLVAAVDIDNGSVCKLGAYQKQDLWTADIPAVEDKVILIYTAPKIYEEYTKRMQEEQFFYNGAGEAMRGFELVDTDRFTLSTEAFAEGATLEVGQYVGVTGTDYKLTTLGTDEPTDRGFYGLIYDIAGNGNYRIIVKRNHPVAW